MKRKIYENKTKNSSKKQKQDSEEVVVEQSQQGSVVQKEGNGLVLREAHRFIQEGNAHYKLGQYQQAIASFTKATELEPTNAEYFCNLGNAHYVLGQDQQAIASFTKATELQPTNAEYFDNLGNAYADEDEYQQAIASFTKATELEPTNAEYFNNLGHTYACEGQDQQAIASFTKATVLQPTNAEYFRNLGNAYACEGQYKHAFNVYLKAMKLPVDGSEKEYCANQIGDLIIKLTKKTHIDQLKLTQLAMNYYSQGGESGEEEVFGGVMPTIRASYMSHVFRHPMPENPTKLAGLPALLALGYSYFSKNEYIKALDAFDLFLKNEEQFDVFVNAEIVAGEILKLNQNVIREGISQTRSLKKLINLDSNPDQHIQQFLQHMKREYHLSATEFLPQVVNGLIRGLQHSDVSSLDLFKIILSYIIDGETLESIQAPGEILKLFGESPTIEIEELRTNEWVVIEVAGETE